MFYTKIYLFLYKKRQEVIFCKKFSIEIYKSNTKNKTILHKLNSFRQFRFYSALH